MHARLTIPAHCHAGYVAAEISRQAASVASPRGMAALAADHWLADLSHGRQAAA